METFRKLFCKNFLVSLFLSLILLTSCSQELDIIELQDAVAKDQHESVTLDQNAVLENNTISNESMQAAVNKIYAQVIESDNQQTKYLLFVEISNSENLPDELYVKGFALTDDGNYKDEVAGDGIYTVHEPIERDLANQYKGKIKILYEKTDKARPSEKHCTIRVTTSGEPCAGDICPDDSILGGTTWFCLCISGCDLFF